MEKSNYKYIIFDGDCGFCNHTMIYIANNDTENQFKLVSNQSKFGLKILENFNISPLKINETILLIDRQYFYEKSEAFIKILLVLPKYRVIGKILKFIPKNISDYFYNIISHFRKKIIKNNCTVPNKNIKEKFIL